MTALLFVLAILVIVGSQAAPYFWPPDAEAVLRLVAAVALVWHPWHEQRKGFRKVFNARIHNYEWDAETILGFEEGGPHFDGGPLTRRMNAVQFAALATVFPALALWGPWWALAGLLSFYGLDQLWTHARKGVPGFWSAQTGLYAALAAFWFAVPEIVNGVSVTLAFGSALAGALLLVIPWWMAYRAVKSA